MENRAPGAIMRELELPGQNFACIHSLYTLFKPTTVVCHFLRVEQAGTA